MELFGANPGRRAIVYFLTIIAVGSLLLVLPVSANNRTISYIDALFTSTSAVCVTGLVVLETGNDFSTFGQVVILILIQLGGLGIMTFATILIMMPGTRLSFLDRMGLSETYGRSSEKFSTFILKAVIVTTLVMEMIGFLVLFLRFRAEFPDSQAAFHAVFHSISAFCNAGFSTFSDNLEGHRQDLVVILTVAFLIICGGLGFVVFGELSDRFRFKKSRLSLHTKLCLTMTAALLIIGTVAFVISEWGNVFKTTGFGYSVADAFFQAVTARTAGFNSIPQRSLTEASIFFTVLLMFIGVCPGSTGGGIKTTTAAVIMLLLYHRFRGRQSVSAFKRSISSDSVTRALTVALLAALVIAIMFAALLFLEERALPHEQSRGWFVDNLFEVVSAFGTVGLSLGMTPKLHVLGKLTVIMTMIIGRVGLLTLAFALARPPKRGELVYLDESVMVG
jgi:trk system potassium uptake protein TrkH